MLALSIMLSFFNIKIVANITISFAWLPSIIIGWYFGPVVGLCMGFVIDSMNYLIHPGYWFWLYALQEPLLGLMVGTLSSLFTVCLRHKKHFLIVTIINQIVLLSFLAFSIFIVFFYTADNNPFFNKITGNGETAQLIKETNRVIRWIILGFLIVLTIIIELLVYKKYHNYKKWKTNAMTFEKLMFLTIIVIVNTLVFSFILGPISAIEYYKAVFGTSTVPSLVKYGVIYYLLPRVIKECFKTPAYILLLTLLVSFSDPIINRFKNHLSNKYH